MSSEKHVKNDSAVERVHVTVKQTNKRIVVETTQIRKNTFFRVRFFFETVLFERFPPEGNLFLAGRRAFFFVTLARFARLDLDAFSMVTRGRFFRGRPIFFFPTERGNLVRGTERKQPKQK